MQPFPPGRFLVLLIFRGGLLSAVEFQDRSDPNSQTRCFMSVFLAVVLPVRKFAFHLDLPALGEPSWRTPRACRRLRNGAIRCARCTCRPSCRGLWLQRECRETAVVVGANFWVAAEKADEGYLFWYMRVSRC